MKTKAVFNAHEQGSARVNPGGPDREFFVSEGAYKLGPDPEVNIYKKIEEARDLIEERRPEMMQKLELLQGDVRNMVDEYPDMPEDERYIEVRLRYHDGSLYLYHGDPSFDQDHRGAWGAGFVSEDVDLEDVLDEMIRDLYESISTEILMEEENE